jgi:hypothetical protein
MKVSITKRPVFFKKKKETIGGMLYRACPMGGK